MPKQPVAVNFSQGLNLKTDPWQLPVGQFLNLENSVFTEQGLLKKRNGFGLLTQIPGASTVTTFSDNLVAISTELDLYSEDTKTVIDTGYIQPLSLGVKSLVRRATSQTTVDVAVASNGLSCSTWLDSDGNSYYQINDSVTGGTIVPALSITNGTEVSATMPRAFVLGQYFIITYLATVSSTPTLRYIAIPIFNPTAPLAPVTVSAQVSNISAAYDGVVANISPGILYLAWNGSDMGGAIRIRPITSTLVQGSVVTIASTAAQLISTTFDYALNQLWLTLYNSSGNTIKVTAYNQNLTVLLAPTTIVSSVTLHNGLTSTANNGVVTVFYEVSNAYSYDSGLRTDYISKNTCDLSGTAGSPEIILRSVGLGSKAVFLNDQSYMLATYGSAYQPTYFLIDSLGRVIAKLAYANGGGYIINQILPQINVSGQVLSVGYLFKDFLASIANPVGPVGSDTGTDKQMGSANTLPVYTQNGINICAFTLNTPMAIAETGGILHLGGGFPWMFDGVKPVEHQFHLWPDAVEVSTDTMGGDITAQQYYYQAIYYWTDGQGNPQYSAPSIPVGIVTTGSASTNTINIPTLRLTYKTSNKVRIRLYRWSTAVQNFYEVTSVSSPTINDPTADSVTITDTFADSAIQGKSLLYTTGGMVEDIAGPSSSIFSLFDDRLWLVDAEDPNLLWFSKQVIEGTGVEFSDLLTFYVAPTQGAQGSTGPTTALCPMDVELVIFKKDAIYYINGTGPDNTGANNQYSQPVFITSTVGCDNPNSIVFTDNGLMFQSDKGIWLLGRNLQTQYIGASVERLVIGNVVTSALVVPGTTQVRFTMDTGITLMYDYFYNQWGSFSNTPAISSTLYQGLHTYLNKFSQIVQETPDQYLDITMPVLMSFTTSWLNLASLQGFERFYYFYFVGRYLSPHKIQVLLAYNYNDSFVQSTVITPNNFSSSVPSPYGDQPAPFGSPSDFEQWKIAAQFQKCQSFQITVNEIYDPSFGVAPGAGLTLSGLNILTMVKRGSRPIPAKNTAG